MKRLVQVSVPLMLLAIFLGLVILASPRSAGARPAPSPAEALSPQVDVMIKTPYLIYPGTVGQMEVLWQLSGTYTSTVEWGTDLTYSSGSASSTVTWIGP